MIPNGFSDLTSLVLEEWTWDDLVKKDEDVWWAFLYPIFLGATIRSAQANYVRDVLSGPLQFDSACKVQNDPIWSKRILEVLNQKLASIQGSPGEGLKKAILKSAIQQVESLALSRTIGDGIKLFKTQRINAKKILDLQKDYDGTLDLVAITTKEVFNFRYIKSVLWLYGCGIAEDVVPPNAHVTRFLNECGYPGFGWSRSPSPDWQIFTPACNCMREIARKVSKELSFHISTKQAQASVWYFQSCKGLLHSRSKRNFTPALLIRFLKNQKWTIGDLSDHLDDVEKLEELTSDLKSYFG